MISFCQDFSISYEYHIYENKTIKKITHKRNGSNISEKTMVKASKLSVVSKNIEQLQLTNKPTNFRQVLHDQVINPPKSIKTNHNRSFSNYVQQRINNDSSQKILAYPLTNRGINLFHENDVQSIEFNQPILRPRVSFNQNLQNNNVNEKNKFHHLTSIAHQTPPISYSRLQQTVSSRKNIPFQNTQSLQSRTIKFKQSIQKLNESIDTKNYEQRYSKLHSRNNHSHSNSFTSNKTINKWNSKNMTSSLSHECSFPQIQFPHQSQFSFFNPKQSTFKSNLEKPKFFNTSSQQNDSFSIPRQSQFSCNIQSENKVIIPKVNFKFQNSIHSQNSLFDAKSIISNDMEEYEDSQCTSVVVQRNFFFQKQEHRDKLFKKSIDKFLFFEPGFISQKRSWVLFKNVKEIENRKMYSIKQFSIEHEIQYFNEYDIYLALKGQTSHLIGKIKENNYFPNLFNALSNNSQKKLYLVKDSFDYILNDYIDHLRNASSVQILRQKLLQTQIERMEFQIAKIFDFFSLNRIEIQSNEELQIQDFIVCQSQTGEKFIKFHSLQKLEKYHNEQIKFYKFDKLKKENQNTSNNYEDYKRKNLNKEKIESLYKKINNACFFS